MRAVTENRIADIIEMRHLRFVEENAVLELARISHHHAVARDHILADVTTAADVAILADPRRPFQNRALLDDCAFADKNRVADERLPDHVRRARPASVETSGSWRSA